MMLKKIYLNAVVLLIGIALALPYFFEGFPGLFNQPEDAFHTFLGAAFGFYLLIYPGLKEKLMKQEKYPPGK